MEHVVVFRAKAGLKPKPDAFATLLRRARRRLGELNSGEKPVPASRDGGCGQTPPARLEAHGALGEHQVRAML